MIKDQKLLDAYVIMESYCEAVLERINLLEQQRSVNEPVNVNIKRWIWSDSDNFVIDYVENVQKN